MAAKFKKGEFVQVNQVIPKGPVLGFSMDEEGNVSYLIEWADAEGVAQQRWFSEYDLIAG